MHLRRFHAHAILVVFNLLLGIACSPPSDRVNEAAMVTDAHLNGPLVLDAALEESGATVACSGEYRACGLGCHCGCNANMKTACYYPSRGESPSSIATWYQAKEATNCPSTGCRAGTLFVCCPDLPAEPMAAANYTAEWITLFATTALRVTKMGTDCATVLFFVPGENYTAISAPFNWGVRVDSVGTCGEAGVATGETTGVGTFTAIDEGTTCRRTKISLHATVFAVDNTGMVKAVRLDVDDLVATMPVGLHSSCP